MPRNRRKVNEFNLFTIISARGRILYSITELVSFIEYKVMRPGHMEFNCFAVCVRRGLINENAEHFVNQYKYMVLRKFPF